MTEVKKNKTSNTNMVKDAAPTDITQARGGGAATAAPAPAPAPAPAAAEAMKLPLRLSEQERQLLQELHPWPKLPERQKHIFCFYDFYIKRKCRKCWNEAQFYEQTCACLSCSNRRRLRQKLIEEFIEELTASAPAPAPAPAP